MPAIPAASERPVPCPSAPGIPAPRCLGRALTFHPESFSHALSSRASGYPPPQPELFAWCMPMVRPPCRPALLIYLVDQRFGRGRDRPTDGWRQHRGLGAFSGYCWRPGGQPCRWGYLVGGVRTGSSQSGRRSYQTRRGAAWRFILHQSNVRPDCMLVSTSASFDFF